MKGIMIKALQELIREMKVPMIVLALIACLGIGIVVANRNTNEALDKAYDTNEIIETKSKISAIYEKPIHIAIAAIGVDSVIQNPDSSKTAVLDEALTRGVVRYPGSALLGQNANMLLFGHSSYLPVVRNKAYKAFNELGKLQVGDEIKIRGSSMEYIYRVIKVSHKKDSEAIIKFTTGKKMITLSTCNTFGKKQDRYIVDAEFIKSYRFN